MGLRERKKEQTRRLIAKVATALFMERGFDHVTVAEVAYEADVSEKTVFNYFHSKEDLFFDEAAERQAALVAAVRDRERSLLDALRRLQGKGIERMTTPEFARWARVIEESPALRAKELELMGRFEAALADAIGLPELESRLVASMIIGVQWQLFTLARERALAGHLGPAAARRLRQDVRVAYDLLERGLRGYL